jgi:hypothetical protein
MIDHFGRNKKVDKRNSWAWPGAAIFFSKKKKKKDKKTIGVSKGR